MKYLLKYKIFESTKDDEVIGYINDIFQDLADEKLGFKIDVSRTPMSSIYGTSTTVRIRKVMWVRTGDISKSNHLKFKWSDVSEFILRVINYLKGEGEKIKFIEVPTDTDILEYGVDDLDSIDPNTEVYSIKIVSEI